MNKGNNPSADTRRPDRAALVIAAVLAAIAGVIFWDVSRLSGYPNLTVEEEQQMNEAFEQVAGA